MTALRVFVVDDDHDLAKGIGDVLEVEGHEAILAFTGEQALAALPEVEFDVAFVDVKLPGINGLQVLREIRRHRPEVPVIMITGFRIDQVVAEAIDQGAVRILRKPFAADALLEALAEIAPAGVLLLADADPGSGRELAGILSGRGRQVLVAEDREAALARGTGRDVDVLVLDLRVPVVAALEVYLELGSQDRNVPTVVLCSGLDGQGETVDALKSLEATGCLFKPFDLERLIGLIHCLCAAMSSTGIRQAEAGPP